MLLDDTPDELAAGSLFIPAGDSFVAIAACCRHWRPRQTSAGF
jgi:hypothetical protein